MNVFFKIGQKVYKAAYLSKKKTPKNPKLVTNKTGLLKILRYKTVTFENDLSQPLKRTELIVTYIIYNFHLYLNSTHRQIIRLIKLCKCAYVQLCVRGVHILPIKGYWVYIGVKLICLLHTMFLYNVRLCKYRFYSNYFRLHCLYFLP